LLFDTDYEYRVLHISNEEVRDTYQQSFHTRLMSIRDFPMPPSQV
jgi:hypothetical protein